MNEIGSISLCSKISVKANISKLFSPLINPDIHFHLPRLAKALSRIRDACGKEFTFDVDFRDVLDKVQATQTTAKERLGEILYESYMSHVAEMYVETERNE